MPESYRALNARQDEKFALHGSSEPQCALPSIRGPPHNDLRQFLLSQSPKYFSNSSIFFISWGSWAKSPCPWPAAHPPFLYAFRLLCGFIQRHLSHKEPKVHNESDEACLKQQISAQVKVGSTFLERLPWRSWHRIR